MLGTLRPTAFALERVELPAHAPRMRMTPPANHEAQWERIDARYAWLPGEKRPSASTPAWRELTCFRCTQDATLAFTPVPALPEYHVVLVLSGQGRIGERERLGEWSETSLRPGQVFVTVPGEPYEVRWRGTRHRRLQTLHVFIPARAVRRAIRQVYGRAAGTVVLRDASDLRDRDVRRLLDLVAAELDRGDAAIRPAVVSLADLLALGLVRQLALHTTPSRQDPALPGFLVQRAQAALARALDQPLEIRTLAAELRLSEFHFSRLFRRAVGMPPAQYRLQCRIRRAQELLRTTTLPIIQIALEVGYATPSHFAARFRRETGVSPSAFRRWR